MKPIHLDPFSILSDDDRERLLRAAETDVSILLLGETGIGKGQLARAIAQNSRRREIVEVNCAALPDELLGSELFGHRKGSFTGAIADRKGILFAAGGKTVFLDEIGEISPKMQRMLLGAVQRSNRTAKPLGADSDLPLPPMRYIFATNRDLEHEVVAGSFREDLLRRIDVVTVYLRPLRERRELIRPYAEKFCEELSKLHALPFKSIRPAAMETLTAHDWPGNVRELKNAIERALVTAPRSTAGIILGEKDFNFSSSASRLAENLASKEADTVRRALEATGGNISKTIRLLGLDSRTALYNRMKKYGIKVERRMQRAR